MLHHHYLFYFSIEIRNVHSLGSKKSWAYCHFLVRVHSFLLGRQNFPKICVLVFQFAEKLLTCLVASFRAQGRGTGEQCWDYSSNYVKLGNNARSLAIFDLWLEKSVMIQDIYLWAVFSRGPPSRFEGKNLIGILDADQKWNHFSCSELCHKLVRDFLRKIFKIKIFISEDVYRLIEHSH